MSGGRRSSRRSGAGWGAVKQPSSTHSPCPAVCLSACLLLPRLCLPGHQLEVEPAVHAPVLSSVSNPPSAPILRSRAAAAPPSALACGTLDVPRQRGIALRAAGAAVDGTLQVRAPGQAGRVGEGGSSASCLPVPAELKAAFKAFEGWSRPAVSPPDSRMGVKPTWLAEKMDATVHDHEQQHPQHLDVAIM